MSVKPTFEWVYEKYYDKIYSYVFSVLLNKSYAEDIVHDTFFAAFENYSRFDPGKSSVYTWLARIAHNKTVNFVRSSAYRMEIASGELPETVSDADVTEQIEMKDMVTRLFALLTPEERDFLELRYVMCLKDSDIAGIFNISPKAVSMRYQRLLKKCRNILENMQAML